MERNLTGKVAVVTGGGTGLGKSISQELARRGATVVLASRKLTNLKPARAEIEAAGGKADVFRLDIRRAAQVEKLVKYTVEKHGSLDILVNNAAGNFLVSSQELSPNGWKTVIDIVLNGTWFCSSFAGRQMIKQGGGVILNIVATYAWTGAPGVVHSAAAKAGVLNLTKTLAAEWGRHKIRVNALAPGIFVSDGAAKNLQYDSPEAQARIARTIPAGRLTTTEEMARQAVYLCGPETEYVTGAVLTADGGQSLSPGVLGVLKTPGR